jgi:hypothetical protein
MNVDGAMAFYKVNTTEEEIVLATPTDQSQQLAPLATVANDEAASTEEEQFVSDADCAHTALQAVNEILFNVAELDTGGEDQMDTAADQLSVDNDQQDPKDSRLFPIFYKSNTALVSTGTSPAVAVTKTQPG